MSESMTSSLSQIRDIALSIQNLTSGCAPGQEPMPPTDSIPLDLISLPRTSSIVPKLVDIGLSDGVAVKISDAFMRSAEELHKTCEETMRNSLAAISNGASSPQLSVLDKQTMLHNVFAAKYAQHTTAWMDEAFAYAQKIIATAPTCADEKDRNVKQAFNHVCTYIPCRF